MASGARWGLIQPEASIYPCAAYGKMASGARWGLIQYRFGLVHRKVIRQNGQWSPLGIDTKIQYSIPGQDFAAKWPVEPVGD